MLIGEVAQRSGVSVRMLRHYDKLGLVTPSQRSKAGYREYADADLRRLFHVESLRSLGMSLAQAATALDDPAFAATDTLTEMIAALEQRVAQEQALLERLSVIERAIRTGPGPSHTAVSRPTGPRSPDGATGAGGPTRTAPPPGDTPESPTPGEDLLEAIALINILRSGDSYKRQTAALRMGTQGQRSAPPDQLARAYLDEPDENAAGALLWALAASLDSVDHDQPDPAAPAIALLAAVADHADARRRARAVRGLGSLGPGALTGVRTFLDDVDPGVATLAALTLGRAGATEALPALVAAIESGDADVEAAEVAAVLDPTAALGLVRERLEVETEPAVRRRLVQALGEFPVDATHDLLETLRADRDPGIARTAAHLLIAR